jgi:hypothetical protein
MFSYHYWWKFFHATLHGFPGFVFGTLVYASIPIYIVTTIITYRKQELIIPIPFTETFSKIYSKISSTKTETDEIKTEPEEIKTEEKNESEYPDGLPPELRIPFMRAKNRMPLTSAISVYNKTNNDIRSEMNNTQKPTTPETLSENNDIPIPMDFDISDDIATNNMNDSVPHFTDIDFDIPIATEPELVNNTTKYLKDKNIEYETYKDYIATNKFVIYEHNDDDFWITDGDSWFATGKQKDSPVSELIDLAKQNELTPVIYLASQNIMNLDDTITNFESLGIRVIKSLDELN